MYAGVNEQDVRLNRRKLVDIMKKDGQFCDFFSFCLQKMVYLKSGYLIGIAIEKEGAGVDIFIAYRLMNDFGLGK